jgi:hypothetical protein
MKSIILTLIFSFCLVLVANTTRAQDSNQSAPALHLKKAGNSALIGYGLFATGGVLLAVAADPEDMAPMAGTLMVGGMIFQIRAWLQVSKAGKIMMNQNRVSLHSGDDGVGLKIRLAKN